MQKPAVQADLLRSYSAYIRADRIESFVKHKISSVDVLRIVYDRHTFGVKPRQHKRGAASEVAGVYLCGLQSVHSPNQRKSVAHGYVGAHFRKLRHMLVARLKNIFHYYACARRNRFQSKYLRLQIGRKTYGYSA